MHHRVAAGVDQLPTCCIPNRPAMITRLATSKAVHCKEASSCGLPTHLLLLGLGHDVRLRPIQDLGVGRLTTDHCKNARMSFVCDSDAPAAAGPRPRRVAAPSP